MGVIDWQSFIVSAVTAIPISASITWLLQKWLGVRLKASVEHEYKRKITELEYNLKVEQDAKHLALKSVIEHEAAVRVTAHSSLIEGQRGLLDRKLAAVDKFWVCFLKFRNGLPAVLQFLDVLTPEQLKGAWQKEPFSLFLDDIGNKKLLEFLKENASFEDVRIYVGEYVWSLLFSYQAILLRTILLVRPDNKKPVYWFDDEGIQSVLKSVLKPDELEEVSRTQFRKLGIIQQKIEDKIRASLQKITSGQDLGEEAIKQAMLIKISAQKLSDQQPPDLA